MKRKTTIILICIIVIVMFSTGFLILSPASPLYYARPRQIEDADSLYQNAVNQFNAAQDYELLISQTQEMCINGSSFIEATDKTIQYDFQPSGKANIYLQETLTSGTHTVALSELFTDGTIYLTVNETPFSSNCDAEQYAKNLIPAIVLDPNLYNNITGVDNGSGYILTFAAPTAAEEWLSPDPITLIDSSGTATINYDGQLQDSTYTVSYHKDGIDLHATIHVSIEQKDVEIQFPQDTSIYTPITNWESLKLLERACGYLIQADCISSNYNDSIYFQAFGDCRTQNILLHAHKERDWSVSIATNTTLTNDTKQDQAVTNSKHELFIENTYSVSRNEGPQTTNTNITADTMHNYFQDQLVSTIMLPQYIASADISQTENILRVQFTGNDAFGLFLAQNAFQVIYQDPNLIANIENKMTTTELLCYLDIDSNSCLPVTSGIIFAGSYSAEGLPYRLEYSANQSYVLPSSNAKDEIVKAAGKTPAAFVMPYTLPTAV